MRVALVEPPRPNLAEPGAVAPLGLGYIAASVRRHMPEVDIFVLNLSGVTDDDAISALSWYDVVGWSCCSLDYARVIDLIRRCKAGDSETKHVIGGPHVTAMLSRFKILPELTDGTVDAAFSGEAEYTFPGYIRGLQFGSVRKTYTGKPIKDLDALPFPLRDVKSPGGAIVSGGGDRSAAIMASRGCPFNCAFCASKAVWPGRVRVRSPGNIVAEIQEVALKCGVNAFWFADDNICVNREWLVELCSMLRDEGVHWRASIRANFAKRSVLDVLSSGGCVELAVGAESFDDSVLKAINKQTTAQQNVDAIRAIYDAGISVRLLLIISTPGETEETVDKNINALESVRGCVDRIVLSTLMPMPGSPIYNDPARFGLKIIETDLTKYDIRMWKPDMRHMHKHWSPVLIDGLSREKQVENIKRMREFVTEYCDTGGKGNHE